MNELKKVKPQKILKKNSYCALPPLPPPLKWGDHCALQPPPPPPPPPPPQKYFYNKMNITRNINKQILIKLMN